MRYLFYIIAVILVLASVLEYTGYSTGGLINVMLMIAIVVIIIKIFQVNFGN